MEVYSGRSVVEGIAIGKIYYYKKDQQQVRRMRVEDSEAEIKRYEIAREEAIEQLKILYDRALFEVGEANAEIFEAHQMLIEDGDYIESVESIIRENNFNAEYAIATTCDHFSDMFEAMDDPYFKERAADVKDISERLINILGGKEAKLFDVTEPVVLIAEDLAPSETVQLDKDMILSFVTQKGSSNSHTAILAKTMDIPAIIGCNIELKNDINGKMCIVDGFEGRIYIDPSDDVMEEKNEALELEKKKKSVLQTLRGRENETIDGKKINIYANIGDIKDVNLALDNDAGGIGLFRSEFIYLGSEDYPTEDEQFEIYKSVATQMGDKKVIIRTLDIGADKQAPYFGLDEEENPAMGMRAIRICLTRPEVFRTQLRALLRASAYGNISIMYPMIISTSEVEIIKQIMASVMKELDDENIPYNKDIEQGIMIETPAAVMISDELAKEVDFFSIGTNDLTQYTLAIDRQNDKLEQFYNAHHPAILKMIKMVVDNAHKNNIWAGICGELGGDTELTKEFLKMGVDELSVSPGKILSLRHIVINTNVSELE